MDHRRMCFLLFFSPLTVIALLLLSAAPAADAWGKEGHYMTCKIAEAYLTDTTKEAVLDLLPPVAGGELAEVCSWADEVRFRYRWASPLHYANTPGVCNFKYSRDCKNDVCVVGAINNYTAQLETYGDSSPSGYNLTESLMFLAHFVGDVHQPLHVSFADDEGGNTIVVRWYKRKTNLHHVRSQRPQKDLWQVLLPSSGICCLLGYSLVFFHPVWDVSIIETTMKDFYENDQAIMIEAIQANITDGWASEVRQWETCRARSQTCANTYASESIELACNYAYKDVQQDSTLGDDYFFSRYPVVMKRLAQGGIRLAAILNRIFDGKRFNVNPAVMVT